GSPRRGKAGEQKAKPKAGKKSEREAEESPTTSRIRSRLVVEGKRSADCGALEGRRSLSSHREIHRLGQSERSQLCGAIRRKEFPGVFSRLRRSAGLGSLLAYHPRHQQPPFLEVVRRRQAERLLQLRRS